MIIKRVLKQLKIVNSLVHKVDGEDAVGYLKDGNNKKPCVILLDLNMPRMNGFEFLKVVKSDDVLKIIPVVVLTTSNQEQHINETFNLGVAGYIVKPVNYSQFVEAVKALDIYWTLSRLPDEDVVVSRS